MHANEKDQDTGVRDYFLTFHVIEIVESEDELFLIANCYFSVYIFTYLDYDF